MNAQPSEAPTPSPPPAAVRRPQKVALAVSDSGRRRYRPTEGEWKALTERIARLLTTSAEDCRTITDLRATIATLRTENAALGERIGWYRRYQPAIFVVGFLVGAVAGGAYL